MLPVYLKQNLIFDWNLSIEILIILGYRVIFELDKLTNWGLGEGTTKNFKFSQNIHLAYYSTIQKIVFKISYFTR